MNIYRLIIVAVALALDAFGVAMGIGLDPDVKRKNKILFTISFGFFQFFFSFIGAYMGYLFIRFSSFPETIGGIAIAIVGIMMVKEGFEEKREKIFLNPKMYFILGISVSIDALVVGFAVLSSIPYMTVILIDTIFIGIITFALTGIAFVTAKSLRNIEFISRYADYIGGIVLILFGIKMIF